MNPNKPIPLGSGGSKGPASMPVPPKLQMPSSVKKPDGGKGGKWLYALAGILIVVGLWYVTGNVVDAPVDSGEEAALEKERDLRGGAASDAPSFLWEFFPEGGNPDTGAPEVRVTLSADGDVYNIGVFEGSCMVLNGSSWELMENELTGVICWFAGGGNEVGVFYENGNYVVKEGIVEEGEEGLRGNYETLFTL